MLIAPAEVQDRNPPAECVRFYHALERRLWVVGGLLRSDRACVWSICPPTAPTLTPTKRFRKTIENRIDKRIFRAHQDELVSAQANS